MRTNRVRLANVRGVAYFPRRMNLRKDLSRRLRDERGQGMTEYVVVATPRHVVLVLSPGLDVYEPASGRRVRFTQEAFVKGRLDLAGWDKPWFAVLPG